MTDTLPSIDTPRAALVLGAAVWPGGVASPTLERRTRHAIGLWQAGQVSHIVGCGGVGAIPPAEAEVIATLCRQNGVPESAILTEAHSTSTDENIRFAAALLSQIKCHDVVVVTDIYHAPRAVLVARDAGLRAVASCPKLKGTHPLRLLRSFMREGPAIAYYTWRIGVRRIKARR